jgi:hypothetical protein
MECTKLNLLNRETFELEKIYNELKKLHSKTMLVSQDQPVEIADSLEKSIKEYKKAINAMCLLVRQMKDSYDTIKAHMEALNLDF